MLRASAALSPALLARALPLIALPVLVACLTSAAHLREARSRIRATEPQFGPRAKSRCLPL
jgi:hypothetical protein